MGNVRNKEAITENKLTAAMEIEKLHNIPAFLLIIPLKRERFCFSVLKLKNNKPLALSDFKEIILSNVVFIFLHFRKKRDT